MRRGEYLHVFLTSALGGGKVQLDTSTALSYIKKLSTLAGQETRWAPKTMRRKE
jgi:hypothetical protein